MVDDPIELPLAGILGFVILVLWVAWKLAKITVRLLVFSTIGVVRMLEWCGELIAYGVHGLIDYRTQRRQLPH